MDPQLKAQCRQTVYVRTPSGVSSSGDAAWNTKVAYSARVEGASKIIESADGTQRTTTHRAILVVSTSGETDPTEWDRVLVSLPWDDSTDVAAGRVPAKAEVLTDEAGALDAVVLWL